ncbi:Hypothetical predicted protein [Mytilus galloprovincialis]|uniref:Reverse transcriptase domain-containing protein n=1 Tax=Mytilus galloprovincialis TaxID=29158 RepID=A0A8B6F9L5_MYTGA|nr:Hypothetical predicted protein [Mytilus galloprovincialis]
MRKPITVADTRIPPNQMEEVGAHIKQLLNQHIIRKRSSPYAALIVIAQSRRTAKTPGAYVSTNKTAWFEIKIFFKKVKRDFKNRIVKDTLKVTIRPDEIQAIHRIPGKQGEHRPVIVKILNSEVKYRIMREKKNMPKQCTFRLVDDVTKSNMELITRLRDSDQLDSAWYFNCAVYGKTEVARRLKFDIFDDIAKRLK